MKNLKQKLCIKLQIDSETNEPVLFKKFINNTSIDKNGNKIEEGVTIILIQTVSDTFARNRVRCTSSNQIGLLLRKHLVKNFENTLLVLD